MGNPSKIVCGELIIILFIILDTALPLNLVEKSFFLLKKRVIFDFIY